MTLEPYQIRAAEWLSRTKRGAVIAPAGSGKTFCAAAALDLVLRAKPRPQKVKIGWIAFTREQVDQARKALSHFESIQTMAEVDVQCAQAGTNWSDRAVIVIDETHRALAPQAYLQIQTCPGAIWGFTATPKTGDPERDRQFEEFFAHNFFVIDRKEVANRLVAARVILLNDTDDLRVQMDEEIQRLMAIRKRQMRFAPEAELYRMVSWQVGRDFGIVKNIRRNEAIIAAASRHELPTLVLVNQVEHGISLANRILGAEPCYAAMGKKKRADVLERFRFGYIRCIVATSLADEGLDLPMASVLVLGSGGRSSAKAEQRTGRVLRSFAGKTEGIIYDFLDRQHPTMERQAKARVALYRKLGYRITT